jgi:hypothetical protein
VRLIDDPGLRAAAGAAGRRRVEAGYSYRAVIPRYLQVLERVAGPLALKQPGAA